MEIKNKIVKIKLTTVSINKHVDKYTRSVKNHLYENHYKNIIQQIVGANVANNMPKVEIMYWKLCQFISQTFDNYFFSINTC